MQNYYPDDAFPKAQANSIKNDEKNESSPPFDLQSLMKLLNSNNANNGKGMNLDMLMSFFKNQNPNIANLLPLLNGMNSSRPNNNTKSSSSTKNNTDNSYISVSKYYENKD